MNSIKLYKLSKWMRFNKIPLTPNIIYYVIFILYRCIVPNSAEIGENTRLSYGGIGVVIHPKVVIGNDVIIGNPQKISHTLEVNEREYFKS